MRGDTLRLAARGGDHEHVDVAVVLSGKGDLRAVGGEYRVAFEAWIGGEAAGGAAFAGGGPEGACVGECDMRFGEGGVLDEDRFAGFGQAWETAAENQQAPEPRP